MTKSSKARDLLVVIGISMGASMGMFINPILQKLIVMFPDMAVSTVRSLSTIVSIVSICVSIPLSMFLGKKAKYKPYMILSAVFFLGGVIPFFAKSPSFGLLMFARVLIGIGAGLCLLRNACIRRLFANDPTKIAMWLGLSNAVNNVLSIVMQPISGFLGDINIRYSFALYFLSIIPLFINTFLIKEPEVTADVEEVADNKVKAPRAKLNLRIFFYASMTILATAFSYPIFTAMSTFVVARSMGEAGVAGSITSLYSVGCFTGSMTFAWFFKRMERFGTGIAGGFLAAGFGTIVLAHSIPVAMAGAFMCGVGFTYTMLLGFKWAGDAADDSSRAFATTLATTGVNLGAFVSTYWITFANKVGNIFAFLPSDAERTYLVTAIVFAFIGIYLTIIDPRPKKTN